VDFRANFNLLSGGWPMVVDDETGNVWPEVYEWLAQHSGLPGRDHGTRWLSTGAYQIGFKKDEMAFAFRMRWGGLG